jgi:nitroreductase
MSDLIIKRRSIRRFQEKGIEPEKMAQIYEAARWAPSWGNQQCCELVVVEETEDKRTLASLLTAKNPATKCMEKAPVIIAVCGTPGKSGFYNKAQVTRYSHWFLYDLGLVSQNICLKACELGLGTVIVGSFDHSQVEKLLNIPEGCEIVALIPLGYPDHAPSAPKRKAIEEFVHFGRFNTSLS